MSQIDMKELYSVINQKTLNDYYDIYKEEGALKRWFPFYSSVEDGWGDILSVYNLPTGKLLIKTEADGSVTTAFNSDESYSKSN